MPAHAPLPVVDSASADRRSIDDLDAEICALARQMNAETYRLLVLVREFDDRFGWKVRALTRVSQLHDEALGAQVADAVPR